MAKLLDFMVRCSNASEDDIVNDILKMAEPDEFDSRDEMESHFEECLGYNPMDYFDKKFINDQFDDVLKNAPYSVQEQLCNKRDEIIERTLECTNDVEETILRKVFINVIKDTVGWIPDEDDDVTVDECISMSVFGENIDDDSEDYDDEDDESEDGIYFAEEDSSDDE